MPSALRCRGGRARQRRRLFERWPAVCCVAARLLSVSGKTMRLIIVRHGESEWNRIGRYQGQLDAPLSGLGLRQAEALADRLRQEPIEIIFTSPLQRAAKTAEAIARY